LTPSKKVLTNFKDANRGRQESKGGGLIENDSNPRLASPYDVAGPLNVVCFNYKNKVFRDFDRIAKL
jgi:hypothetical protein